MAKVSLPADAREQLDAPSGTVVVQCVLDDPLRPRPEAVTMLEETSAGGTVVRVVAGPRFTWRFVRQEPGGEEREAVANLAPVAGQRELLVYLRWSEDGEVALDVTAKYRQGTWARGASAGYERR